MKHYFFLTVKSVCVFFQALYCITTAMTKLSIINASSFVDLRQILVQLVILIFQMKLFQVVTFLIKIKFESICETAVFTCVFILFQTLYEQCNSGKSLDVSAFAKSGSQKSWTAK